jgi:mannosyl-3-phosphoglycerate phosphatase
MPQNKPRLIIFSDLDGTLLDHETYKWEEATEALDLCRVHHIPIILVSSKTRAEIEVISRQLGLNSPFVSENGGGIFFPKEVFPDPPIGTVFAKSDSYWKYSLGIPYHELVSALKDIGKILGWTIRGFSDMTIEEIATLTGLNRQEAQRASKREFDEPFILPKDMNYDLRLLEEEAGKRDLRLSTGGRFHHLHGQNDKGEAVVRIIDWYRKTNPRIITIALGDSPNDFGMLERVEHPILVRSSKTDTSLMNRMPRLRITRKRGPEGWNETILDILQEKLGGGNI